MHFFVVIFHLEQSVVHVEDNAGVGLDTVAPDAAEDGEVEMHQCQPGFRHTLPGVRKVLNCPIA